MEHERTSAWTGATPVGPGGAGPARRLHLVEAPEGAGDAILSRLDELARLLLQRDAEQEAAGRARAEGLAEALDALGRRQDAEVTSLREAMAARVAEVEATAGRALAEAERRLDAALAAQGQALEALRLERDRSGAALRLLQDGLSAQVAEGVALAEEMGSRLGRLEAAAPGGELGEALAGCAGRLDEVLFHLEADAMDRLPAGGRPLKAALRLLSEQIAATRADLRALGGEGSAA